MLDGPWGSGKTYLAKKIVRDEDIRHAYVSLNGVKTAEEFQRRLIYSVYPVFADKTVQALGALTRGALGVFRFKADLKVEDLIEVSPDRLLILTI